MTTMTQEYGWLHEVDTFPLGSALVAPALEGDEILYVADASYFDPDGGALRLNGVTMGYLSADADDDTLVLSGPLVAENVADEGDTVAVWDVDNNRVAAEQQALVEFANGDGDDDPIPAALSAGIAGLLRLGSRGGRGETVLLEEYNGGWRVIDVVGTEGAVDGSEEGFIPSPPEVTVSTSGYVDVGRQRAVVLISWTEVTTYTDGTEMSDPVSGYVVQSFKGTAVADSNWQLLTTTSDTVRTVTLDNMAPGAVWSYRVRALDKAGNEGEWSEIETITTATDNVPPATPSAPTLSSRLGTITATWDGKNSAGGAMDADFAFAEIHASASSGFTPVKGDTNTMVARLSGAGYGVAANLPYNSTRYFRIIAVDSSGNVSLPSTQATSFTTPLVDTDVIGKVISGAKIVDGSITASQSIIGETITGGLIQALAIRTGLLDVNAVTAEKIEFGSLNGVLVTGLQIQTSTSSTLGIKLKNTGFEAFDGSQRTFYINASTGSVEMKGSIKAGSSIYGSSFVTSSFDSGQRIVIRNDGSGGVIEAFNGLSGETPAKVNPYSSGGASGIELRSGLTPSKPGEANLTLLSGAGGTSGFFNAYCSTGSISASTNFGLLGPMFQNTIGDIAAVRLQTTGPDSTAAAANAYINSTGQIAKSTSSLRYKEVLGEADLESATVLSLVSRRYTSRGDDSGRVWLGFIAEEAHANGLGAFVDYDTEGRPDGFHYGTFVAAHQIVLRDHDDRIVSGEARTTALEGRVEDLEAVVAELRETVAQMVA